MANGIVCTDDLTAILVLQAAKELAIKVPEQLKVTGFDGTTQVQLYRPELSTIVQPISDIAEVLVEVLKARIKQPSEPLKQMQYTLPVSFLQRDSTKFRVWGSWATEHVSIECEDMRVEPYE